jgi:hypothetical protein
MKCPIFLGAVALALVFAGVSAEATQQGQGAVVKWKWMDGCAKQAQGAYPDFNAESNAKRDAKLKECLNAQGLPPRQPLPAPGSR